MGKIQYKADGHRDPEGKVVVSHLHKAGEAPVSPCAVRSTVTYEVLKCLCVESCLGCNQAVMSEDGQKTYADWKVGDFWDTIEKKPYSEHMPAWERWEGTFTLDWHPTFTDDGFWSEQLFTTVAEALHEKQEKRLAELEAAGEKPQYGWSYCRLCGNEQVENREEPCDQCKLSIIVKGLERAWEMYETCRVEHRQCCGGLTADKTHFHFHGKYWEGTYKGPPSLGCEMGVQFHADHAETYFIWDMDHTCGSETYGEDISYDREDFWEVLMKQLDEAPKVMWGRDWYNCPRCGNHASAEAGGCCEMELLRGWDIEQLEDPLAIVLTRDSDGYQTDPIGYEKGEDIIQIACDYLEQYDWFDEDDEE